MRLAMIGLGKMGGNKFIQTARGVADATERKPTAQQIRAASTDYLIAMTSSGVIH